VQFLRIGGTSPSPHPHALFQSITIYHHICNTHTTYTRLQNQPRYCSWQSTEWLHEQSSTNSAVEDSHPLKIVNWQNWPQNRSLEAWWTPRKCLIRTVSLLELHSCRCFNFFKYICILGSLLVVSVSVMTKYKHNNNNNNQQQQQ
jgi:hypothetical protein